MNRLGILISLYALVLLTACNSKKDEVEESNTGKFTVTSPLVIDTSITKEYVSQIQSLQNIEVRAMVKGYIESINVDEGQQVKAGQVLFKIMPKEYEADFMKAKAEVTAAEIEVKNSQTLADKNIISSNELAMTKAKLEAAKAELDRAQLFLSFTDIKAPFDGIIDRIKFKVGSFIDEGTLLTTLSNNKEIYVYFNFSESEYLAYKSRLKLNEKDSVTLLLADNTPHKYKGVIENVEGEFDNNTGNIALRAKFPNPELLLKHGETGKVQLTVALKKAIIIPQEATYELQDKIYVYVVDKNNIVKSVNIKIQQKLPNLYIIESGISADDKILLEGVQNVKDGDKISFEFKEPKKVVDSLQLIVQ